MDVIEARGIVKNGQVVLDEPLNAPDGTEVFIEVVVPELDDANKVAIARQAVLNWVTDPELRRKFELEFPEREAS